MNPQWFSIVAHSLRRLNSPGRVHSVLAMQSNSEHKLQWFPLSRYQTIRLNKGCIHFTLFVNLLTLKFILLPGVLMWWKMILYDDEVCELHQPGSNSCWSEPAFICIVQLHSCLNTDRVFSCFLAHDQACSWFRCIQAISKCSPTPSFSECGYFCVCLFVFLLTKCDVHMPHTARAFHSLHESPAISPACYEDQQQVCTSTWANRPWPGSKTTRWHHVCKTS